jgi:hypothetical protein
VLFVFVMTPKQLKVVVRCVGKPKDVTKMEIIKMIGRIAIQRRTVMNLPASTFRTIRIQKERINERKCLFPGYEDV